MEIDEDLLAEIDGFLAEARITPTAFGRLALGDPRFVFSLRAGRDCRRSTIVRVRQQIAAYRDTGAFLSRSDPEAA